MEPEEIRALLRACAALALAQHAAERCSDAYATDPYLVSVVKCQALAARELDCLLERALSGGAGGVTPRDVEEECSALLM